MKLTNWAGPLLLAGALLTGTRTASASEVFLKPVSDIGWKGDCRLCHTANPGTFGTATQPFAKALISKGLTIRSIPSLETALDALNAANADTDSDGIEDYQELVTHTNPNNTDVVEDKADIQYGCFNSIVGRRDLSASGVGVLAGLLTAAALWRTRRRST